MPHTVRLEERPREDLMEWWRIQRPSSSGTVVYDPPDNIWTRRELDDFDSRNVRGIDWRHALAVAQIKWATTRLQSILGVLRDFYKDFPHDDVRICVELVELQRPEDLVKARKVTCRVASIKHSL
jgi:hypothetical protein